jgi:hypothetical protein
MALIRFGVSVRVGGRFFLQGRYPGNKAYEFSKGESVLLVLFVLLGALLVFRGIGALGVETFATWPAATRYALAVMLFFHSERALHNNERGSGSHGATVDSSSAGDGLLHGCLRVAWSGWSDYSFPATRCEYRSDCFLHCGVSCQRACSTERGDFGWQTCHFAVAAGANAGSFHCSDVVVYSVAI